MPQVIKTLGDIVNREDRYDIKQISFYKRSDDGELITVDKTLLDVYMPLVRSYVVKYAVLDKEREYYKYKPQLLSLDVYGTMSLFWLIMQLNDRECPSKFYLRREIYLIPASVLAKAYTIISTKSKT
ncbi:MAG: hypothetical protein K2F99_09950, partial [Muribaculaceae bacterium]|nr:hypothetical protein [Muribaculaceae bacterium]